MDDAEAIADVTVRVSYDGSVWLKALLFPVVFAILAWGLFGLPIGTTVVACSVICIVVLADRIRRQWFDPGFVFDDTAVRIPAFGLSPFAVRVFYADIREISVNHRYTLDLETTKRPVSRGTDYTSKWDRETVERELRVRTARALAETEPKISISILGARSQVPRVRAAVRALRLARRGRAHLQGERRSRERASGPRTLRSASTNVIG